MIDGFSYENGPEQLKQREKAEIRKAERAVSTAFIALLTVMCFWSRAVYAACRFFGIDVKTVYSAFKTGTIRDFIQIWLSTFAFVFVFTLLIWITGHKISGVIDFKMTKDKGGTAGLVLFGLAGCGISVYLTSLAGNLLENIGFHYTSVTSSMDKPDNFYYYVLSFLSTAVFPALVEEYAMRGAVLGILKKFGEGFAIIISSTLFGLMHSNFEQIPYAFMIGMVLGFITVKSKSIIPAIIIHSLNNAFSWIISIASFYVNGEIMPYIYAFYTLLLASLGILGIYLIFRNKNSEERENFFKLNSPDMLTSTRERVLTYFISPLFIISVLFVLYAALFLYRVR